MNGTLYTWDEETPICKVSDIQFESPRLGVVDDPDYERRRRLFRQTDGFTCFFHSEKWLSLNDTEKKRLKIEDGEFINMWLRIEIEDVKDGTAITATARVTNLGVPFRRSSQF
jgi:hypothetical protein